MRAPLSMTSLILLSLSACAGTGFDESGDESPIDSDSQADGGESASTGGSVSSGGDVGTGGAGTGGETGTGGNADKPVSVRVMSLNVWGHMTMPQEAPVYAALIASHSIDVVGIQEGVNDWQLATELPSDYSRADALAVALGECWEQRFQVFVNTCNGVSFVSHERFDLTDGPNATRTGESAVLAKEGIQFALIDIHWDHEDATARAANASETAAAANAHTGKPTIVLGDFNSACDASDPGTMASHASLSLTADAGIDCIFTRDATGAGQEVDGGPSDHPAVISELTF